MLKTIIKSVLILSIAAMAIIFSSGAWAADMSKALCIPNQAGGNIVLTGAKHPTEDALIVMATVPSGEVFYGSWALVGKTTVMIIWENGKTSAFNGNQFKPCEL